MNNKCEIERDQSGEPERLAESKVESIDEETSKASNQVPEPMKESASTENNDNIRQLSEEVNEFDRKVESLDKFKLELYQ